MIIQSKRVWKSGCFQPLQIKIENGIIKSVQPYNAERTDKDYGNDRIIPGMIDIHTHGRLGKDASHATEQWIRKWMESLPYEGVTGVTPAISTAPQQDILQSLSMFSKVIEDGYNGCEILGIYSEGPFISKKYKGAQDERYQVIPNEDVLNLYQKASGNRMRYIMVAPEELDENMNFIHACTRQGIRVAIGHTGATFEICKKAREAGAVSFTHTYNGMSGFGHREPGTAGAAMYFKDMYAELIGDGIHVCKVSAVLLAEAKGKDHLISVTDSNRCKGFPVGKMRLFDQNITVCKDGVARLENGTIAGSVNSLNNILKNEIENFGFSEELAINSVTCNPAKMLGFNHKIGYIEENYKANLTVLKDDYSIQQTYIKGIAMCSCYK